VNYGITTSRAHLDRLDEVAVEGEIDWDRLTAAVGPPVFAGRYFLGYPTDAELAGEPSPGGGFALWAHGEGADGGAPERIVPIQRADATRQEAAGDEGATFGRMDGEAIARGLDFCLTVGDLDIIDTAQILVFLEVADGTELTLDYWSAWATAVYEATLRLPSNGDDRIWDRLIQPLVPGVACAFGWDEKEGAYLPDENVRGCLTGTGKRGMRTLCHGLWARPLEGDPSPEAQVNAFTWENLGEFTQPRPILGTAATYDQRVPVRFLRVEGLETLSLEDASILELVTLDWAAEGLDDPTGAVFRTTDWSSARGPDTEHLEELPTQLGVDAGANLTNHAATTLHRSNLISVTRLAYSNYASVQYTPVDLEGRCEFALRYYRTNDQGFGREEALALWNEGILPIAIFQGYARQDENYTHDLIWPFTAGRGSVDAGLAFTWAAETMGQTPYTPIYFAVDFPLDDPDYYGVATPGIDVVLQYFRDVHRGHRTHLETHPSHPYYVGVYGSKPICQALYRAGLASHFWQTPWNGYTDAKPFAHLNVWQVGMFNHDDAVDDNPVLMQLPRGLVDLDVAWGDPGAFEP